MWALKRHGFRRDSCLQLGRSLAVEASAATQSSSTVMSPRQRKLAAKRRQKEQQRVNQPHLPSGSSSSGSGSSSSSMLERQQQPKGLPKVVRVRPAEEPIQQQQQQQQQQDPILPPSLTDLAGLLEQQQQQQQQQGLSIAQLSTALSTLSAEQLSQLVITWAQQSRNTLFSDLADLQTLLHCYVTAAQQQQQQQQSGFNRQQLADVAWGLAHFDCLEWRCQQQQQRGQDRQQQQQRQHQQRDLCGDHDWKQQQQQRDVCGERDEQQQQQQQQQELRQQQLHNKCGDDDWQQQQQQQQLQQPDICADKSQQQQQQQELGQQQLQNLCGDHSQQHQQQQQQHITLHWSAPFQSALQVPFLILPNLMPDLKIKDFKSEITLHQDVIYLSDDNGNVREVPEARLTGWQSDIGATFEYSGKEMIPTTGLTPHVAKVRDMLHQVTGQYFDSVLVNYYEDGKCGMRYHVDPLYGKWTPNSAVVSLGDTRQFVFRRIDDHSIRWNYRVANGDVVVMFGDCQDVLQHAVKVEATADAVGPRISLVYKQRVRSEDGIGA